MIRLWPNLWGDQPEAPLPGYHPVPQDRVVIDFDTTSLEALKAALETEEVKKALEGR